MPADVYVPDRGKIATVKSLALILALTVVFSVAPVVSRAQLNLEQAAWWARLVLLLAAIQAVYIVWMLNRPDWASVWIVMLAFAVVATLYGMASAITVMWPPDELMPLGLEPIRQPAKAWCGAVLLTMSLATYLCGRTSAKWRRQFELETAGRNGRNASRSQTGS